MKRTIGGDRRRRVRRTEQERRELIEACDASGLSQAAFCREQQINPATFYRWLRVRRSEEVRFAEVEVTPVRTAAIATAGEPPLEIVLSSGMRIAVRDSRWLPHVADLVRAMEARPC